MEGAYNGRSLEHSRAGVLGGGARINEGQGAAEGLGLLFCGPVLAAPVQPVYLVRERERERERTEG